VLLFWRVPDMFRHAVRDTFRAVMPWAAAFLALAATTAASERGYPLITVFPAEQHRAGPQTFDLVQDSRGVLYFGNLHGLLTYDGAWWRLHKLPDEQVALSLATNPNGEIALGLVNDFGLFERQDHGSYAFRSLLPMLPEPERDIRDVRGICSTPAGFLYVTEQRLLLWNGSSVRIAATFDADTSPRGCHADDHGVFIRTQQRLLELDMETFEMRPAGVDGHILLLLRDAEGRMIVGVRDEGLSVLEAGNRQPYAPEASAWLKDKLVTSGCRLGDGRLIIATRQNGVLILEPSGAIDQIIGPEAGLPDAILSEVAIDREGALWLAMEGPIVRIDLSSPVTLFDARSGLRGTASDVLRHQGKLYAASSHGLHVVEPSGSVRRISGIDESVWRLTELNGELVIGSERGIYLLEPAGTLRKIVDLETEVYELYPSPSDPSRIWIARGDGISSLRRSASGWRDEGLLRNLPRNISSLVERDGVLWAGSVFNGILKIEGALEGTPRPQQYGTGEINVFALADRIVFVKATGSILHLEKDRLVPDPLLRHVSAPRGFFVLMEDSQRNVWINSTPPRLFRRLPGGSYAREGQPLVAVTATDIQTMRMSEDGILWFSSDKGLFRYEGDTRRRVHPQPAPLIQRVVAGENEILFSGGIHSSDTRLRHNLGRIHIEFAPVSYRPGVNYQYRLDPIDRDWSDWVDQPFIDYTTLAGNEYTFRLRARGPDMIPSPETQWRFIVRPPWYLTRWAYLLWALLIAGAIAAVIRIRTSSLRKQAERLRARVTEQTAELQQAVRLLEDANVQLEALTLEDDLTGIANRRYFERALAEEWNRARRHGQPLALILIDLDHFKDLNDQLGHPAGDECLRQIGAFLADKIRRSGEVVARYGGEEFAILVPGASSEIAVGVAETARSGIERLSIGFGDHSSRRMTASCGVASIIPSSSTPEILVASADRALYAAKHSGRNCVRLADQSTTGTWLHEIA
jgi:diguanylate cyclase (GGDEF)-like protein